MIDESCLPLELPEVAKFLPTETGEPPLGHASKWAWDTANKCVVDNEKIDNITVFPLELNTMPGFAGSSAYYLRYMDPRNHTALIDKKVDEYWRNVDLYVGGTEHATGHLIYSRFWNKFLHDLGVSAVEEPFQKTGEPGYDSGKKQLCISHQGYQYIRIAEPERPVRHYPAPRGCQHRVQTTFSTRKRSRHGVLSMLPQSLSWKTANTSAAGRLKK